ncbi:MAG: AAA family ATPase [Oscillospiraceae bacterium]|nr:AAA family ATPase [Oscillospiraceae bacterium]
MSKIVLVTSGKGGVGKSTVSALLGEALAYTKSRTLIIELDSGLRSLDVALGVSEQILFDMGDIIRGSCSTKDAVLECPFCPGLSLITAAAKSVSVTEDVIKKIIAEMGFLYDYIILDCPAGIGTELSEAAKCSDIGLVVTTPDPSAVRGARAAGAVLASCGVKNRRLIIERCPLKAKKLYPLNNLDEIIDGTEIQLISVIWEDPDIRNAMDSGEPIDDTGLNYENFRALAERIRGKYIPLGFK